MNDEKEMPIFQAIRYVRLALTKAAADREVRGVLLATDAKLAGLLAARFNADDEGEA
jgi:hypothetical protein